MKRNIIIILLMALCSTAFADIILQQDFDGPGVDFDIEKDCFNVKNPVTTSISSYPATGLSVSLLYEFNSKDTETPLHFYTGVNTGLVAVGIPLSVEAGMFYRVAETPVFTFAVNPDLRIGALEGIKGGEHFYTQASCDFLVSFTKFPRIYLGAGVSSINLIIIDIYKGHGVSELLYSYNNLHAVAGVKIPLPF